MPPCGVAAPDPSPPRVEMFMTLGPPRRGESSRLERLELRRGFSKVLEPRLIGDPIGELLTLKNEETKFDGILTQIAAVFLPDIEP